jgi:hypothetical protein
MPCGADDDTDDDDDDDDDGQTCKICCASIQISILPYMPYNQGDMVLKLTSKTGFHLINCCFVLLSRLSMPPPQLFISSSRASERCCQSDTVYRSSACRLWGPGFESQLFDSIGFHRGSGFPLHYIYKSPNIVYRANNGQIDSQLSILYSYESSRHDNIALDWIYIIYFWHGTMLPQSDMS